MTSYEEVERLVKARVTAIVELARLQAAERNAQNPPRPNRRKRRSKGKWYG